MMRLKRKRLGEKGVRVRLFDEVALQSKCFTVYGTNVPRCYAKLTKLIRDDSMKTSNVPTT